MHWVQLKLTDIASEKCLPFSVTINGPPKKYCYCNHYYSSISIMQLDWFMISRDPILACFKQKQFALIIFLLEVWPSMWQYVSLYNGSKC